MISARKSCQDPVLIVNAHRWLSSLNLPTSYLCLRQLISAPPPGSFPFLPVVCVLHWAAFWDAASTAFPMGIWSDACVSWCSLHWLRLWANNCLTLCCLFYLCYIPVCCPQPSSRVIFLSAPPCSLVSSFLALPLHFMKWCSGPIVCIY